MTRKTEFFNKQLIYSGNTGVLILLEQKRGLL
jgi:hypothetical protein